MLIPSRTRSLCLVVAAALTLARAATNAVVVPATQLNKTGYWQTVYNKKCDIELWEAYGKDASVSYAFVGTGIVARLQRCPTCARVEIQIDNEEPEIVDLSADGRYECAQRVPTFVKTDLEHEKHVITITRLDENAPLEILQLEYLTYDQPAEDKHTEGADVGQCQTATDLAMDVMKHAARKIVYQGAEAAVGIVAMTAVRFLVGPVLEGLVRPTVLELAPNIPIADSISATVSSSSTSLGSGGGDDWLDDASTVYSSEGSW
ncbi:hypothetical protein HGRIS_001836 [Hohenbuehelia grisea]|uniref:Uncharacterized protein n=1 Tax=Hohenbuehelia grisea TaxID=104357 RepID=A0ABR3JIT3_9AGAR